MPYVSGSIPANARVYAGIAFSSDKSKIYLVGRESFISVSTITRTVLGTVALTGKYPEGVACTSTKAYTANGDTTVSVIDLATNSVSATITCSFPTYRIAVNPGGTKAYVTHYYDYGVAGYGGTKISVINLSTNAVSKTVTVGTKPQSLVFSPDGSKAYVVNFSSNTVSVINTSTDSVSATIAVGAGPSEIAINPAGTKIYVSNDTDKTMSVINASNNTLSATISHSPGFMGVTVGADGSKVFSASTSSNSIAVIDATNNTVSSSIYGIKSPWSVLNNGNYVYATGGAGNLYIVDTVANPPGFFAMF